MPIDMSTGAVREPTEDELTAATPPGHLSIPQEQWQTADRPTRRNLIMEEYRTPEPAEGAAVVVKPTDAAPEDWRARHSINPSPPDVDYLVQKEAILRSLPGARGTGTTDYDV
tara:strand:+ start:3307 stop:3645 length:339 start_codon:yes stop_codon:yes gene_type:complete